MERDKAAGKMREVAEGLEGARQCGQRGSLLEVATELMFVVPLDHSERTRFFSGRWENLPHPPPLPDWPQPLLVTNPQDTLCWALL